MHPTLTITPQPAAASDPHAGVRAEIARIDADVWARRNASHLTKNSYRHIDALERKSAHLSASLPENRKACTQRALEQEILRQKFERGRELFEQRQAIPLADARTALCALTDPALPPALHRAVTNLISDIDQHCAQMRDFAPADGLPDALLRLLPLSER